MQRADLFVYFLYLLLVVSKIDPLDAQGGYTIRNPIGFPPGYPFMGIFAAVATPLDLPGHRDIFFSANVEAHYVLPQWNQTFLTYPPIIAKRSLVDRKTLYDILERKLDRFGYKGRPCLLRAICEASEFTFKEGNGVLGDIIHVILSPSASKYEGIESAYAKAEKHGSSKGNCHLYRKKCTVSLLDWFSFIDMEEVA